MEKEKIPGWPHCPRCKGASVPRDHPEVFPPQPVWAVCRRCGHEWQICGAKNRAGNRCGKWPMQNGRCDRHGGKSTGRPVIHGRRSKHLPERLQERAEEALSDPELVGLLEDLALVEALIIERLPQLGEESPALLWGQAQNAWDLLDAARQEGALAMDAEPGAAFAELGRILANGLGRARAESEILNLQEHRRKLADTEIKRQHTLNQFVSAKELNVLLAAILTIIRDCVRDADDRRSVASRLTGLVHRGPGALPRG